MDNQGQRRDSGAAAVEFALIAMLLITLVVGIFEGGRLWMLQGALSQAAREGARDMAIHGDAGQANGVISSRVGSLGAVPDVTVSGSGPTCVVTATATITNVGTMTGLVEVAPLGGITLTGKAQMRCGG